MRLKLLAASSIVFSLPAFSMAGAVAQDLPGPARRPDASKLRIEKPIVRLLEGTRTVPYPAFNAPPDPTAADTRTGVKVAPGKVAWRASFEQACQLAQASKKPVLLFQMMGKLDDEFC